MNNFVVQILLTAEQVTKTFSEEPVGAGFVLGILCLSAFISTIRLATIYMKLKYATVSDTPTTSSFPTCQRCRSRWM